MHECMRLFGIRATIHLKFHSVAIWIPIVHRQCHTMMHSPVRRDAELFEAVVGIQNPTFGYVYPT